MDKSGIYSKEVIKHFRNPHNYGKIKDPDGVGKVGNLACGDVMWLYIKVGKNKKRREVIKNIKFETFGCVAALATSSVITDIAKGKTLEEAIKINKDNVIKSLGGLPPIKVHCSLLAADALHEAVYDYLSKNKKPIPEDLENKHKIIEGHKKIIEKKYKKWIRMEEGLRDN